jgi:hypothetical protein
VKIPMFLLTLVAAHATAAPFVISDAYTSGLSPTHCGLLLDAQAKVDVPVALDAQGRPYCKFDLAPVATGAHRIRATAVIIDPVWGRLESAESLPFDFSRPGAPGVPSGLLIRGQ